MAEGNPSAIGGFRHKAPVVRSLNIFCVVSWNEVLNKCPSCRGFVAPQLSRDDPVMVYPISYFSVHVTDMICDFNIRYDE